MYIYIHMYVYVHKDLLSACYPSAQNMMSEQPEHDVRSPRADSARCASSSHQVFGQDVLGVRTVCSGCWNNMFRMFEQNYSGCSNNNIYLWFRV